MISIRAFNSRSVWRVRAKREIAAETRCMIITRRTDFLKSSRRRALRSIIDITALGSHEIL